MAILCVYPGQDAICVCHRVPIPNPVLEAVPLVPRVTEGVPSAISVDVLSFEGDDGVCGETFRNMQRCLSGWRGKTTPQQRLHGLRR